MNFSRRIFLAGTAGSMLRLQAAGDPAACTGGPCPLPEIAVKPFPVESAKPMEFPAGSAKPRRLWSQLTASEKSAISKDLRNAYGRMAERDPADPLGLLYQGWLHRYCCGG